MKNIWDDRDKELNLRDAFAKLVASKVSGLDPLDITPVKADFDLADRIGEMIEREERMLN